MGQALSCNTSLLYDEDDVVHSMRNLIMGTIFSAIELANTLSLTHVLFAIRFFLSIGVGVHHGVHGAYKIVNARKCC